MDSPAIPVFLAGPFPVLHSSRVVREEGEVELSVGIIVFPGGLPTILASSRFAFDDTWDRIEGALASGDAKLGVAGLPYREQTMTGTREFPSAYIGLECANGERLVLAHIRGLDAQQQADAYAHEVLRALLSGLSPDELGETIDD